MPRLTKVIDGNLAKVCAWYDNEWGFSNRMLDTTIAWSKASYRMKVLRMTDTELRNKRVLIREDLNVPVSNGVVTSDARIRASLPTIRYALDQHAKVFIASHLGRPEEGVYAEEFSLAPVAAKLSELLGKPVALRKNWLDGVDTPPGTAVLLENVRFNKVKRKTRKIRAQKMASLCDVYVMDAFGTAHRAEASTHGVAKFAKVAAAGPLLVGELEALERALHAPARPLVAIVGGSKVSTKLTVLEEPAGQGGQADRGRRHRQHVPRRHRREHRQVAARSRNAGRGPQAARAGEGQRHRDSAPDGRGRGPRVRRHGACGRAPGRPGEAGRDDPRHGPGQRRSLRQGHRKRRHHRVERPGRRVRVRPVRRGHQALATAIARSKAFSLAGGGDTSAAIEKYGVEDGISYISTGGGAFLEFVEGKTLPAVAILEARAADGRRTPPQRIEC